MYGLGALEREGSLMRSQISPLAQLLLGTALLSLGLVAVIRRRTYNRRFEAVAPQRYSADRRLRFVLLTVTPALLVIAGLTVLGVALTRV